MINLHSLMQQIEQRRRSNRTALIMTVDDVEAMVIEIERSRRLGRHALRALLDHDLEMIRNCCRQIAGEA